MNLDGLFKDIDFKAFLEKHLPYLFEEARYINTNENAMNMSVGRDREDIIKLIFKDWIDLKYGMQSTVDVPEKLDYDAVFFDKKVQLKTITVEGNAIGKLKLNWASGLDNAQIFKENFSINNDIIYARILTDKNKSPSKIAFHHMPTAAQLEIFNDLGIEGYLKIIEQDSKGVLLSTKALKKLVYHKDTTSMSIQYNLQKEVEFKNRIEFWNYRFNQSRNQTNCATLDLHICKNSLEESSSILTR